jgi:hypothetical protein
MRGRQQQHPCSRQHRQQVQRARRKVAPNSRLQTLTCTTKHTCHCPIAFPFCTAATITAEPQVHMQLRLAQVIQLAAAATMPFTTIHLVTSSVK